MAGSPALVCQMLGYNIVQLLFAQTAGTHRVYPRQYLNAALETIVLTIFVTFAFTWAPDQIWDHPAFIKLGAFNFCFGWYAARLAPTGRSPLTACGAPQGLCGGKLHRSLYELVHRLLPLALHDPREHAHQGATQPKLDRPFRCSLEQRARHERQRLSADLPRRPSLQV